MLCPTLWSLAPPPHVCVGPPLHARIRVPRSSTGGQLGGSGGGLGSTQPAATEDEKLDKRAKKARSNQGIYDIDQYLVDDWGRASDGGNGDKEGLHEVYRRWEVFSSM